MHISRAGRSVQIRWGRAGEKSGESADDALNQGTRVLTRVHRGRRGRAADSNPAQRSAWKTGSRRGATAPLCRYDADEGSPGNDAREIEGRDIDGRAPVSG